MSNQRKFGYEAFEKWEVSLVKKKARKLIGKFGITESNVEDLEQELFLHIFLKKKGGSSKAQVRHQGKSVMAQILDNRVRDIIEKAQTKKREGDLKSDSLHRELGQSEEGDSMTYEDVLSEDTNVEHNDGIKDLDVIPCVPFAERLANRVTVVHAAHLL